MMDFTTEKLEWNSRYFGMYTFSCMLTGLFLGMGSWFALVSIVMFFGMLYAYAKNKEIVELENKINKFTENEKKERRN
jgi:hypothetical protein